ncbi:TIR domain-containing protein, partial [Roseivivax isoporae]
RAPARAQSSADVTAGARVFLSFSSKDAAAADRIVAAFAAGAPEVRVFDFRRDIEIGVAYQREVDAALKRSDRALCLVSPDYMASGECLEELMVARLRNKRSGFGFLWPVYWRNVPDGLEEWIQILNYADCRECDSVRLETAVRALAAQLASRQGVR